MNALRLSLVVIGLPLSLSLLGPQVRAWAMAAGRRPTNCAAAAWRRSRPRPASCAARGYEVLRHGASFARPEPDDNGGTQFLQQAGDWLSGMPGNQAQATIVCRS
jgi:hypothetical protein